MSPTSFLAAPPRDFVYFFKILPGAGRGTRTRTDLSPQDFKSRASTTSASPATPREYNIFIYNVKHYLLPPYDFYRFLLTLQDSAILKGSHQGHA